MLTIRERHRIIFLLPEFMLEESVSRETAEHDFLFPQALDAHMQTLIIVFMHVSQTH